MEKLYVYINKSVVVVDYNEKIFKSTENQLLSLIIIPTGGEISIRYTYGKTSRILSGINLLTYLNSTSSSSFKECIGKLCNELSENITDEFKEELSIYPGLSIKQKLCNFFLVSTGLHFVTFDMIKTDIEDDNIFHPWNIILPEYDDIKRTYNYSYYKCLRYYIFPIREKGTCAIASKVLIILEKFWLLFNEEIEDLEITSDIGNSEVLSIYGAMYNMYKFNLKLGTEKEVKSEASYEDQKYLFSELDTKYLENVEKVERISEFMQNMEDKFKDIYKLSDTLEDKITDLNSVQNEFDTYAGELKKFVEESKYGLNEEIVSKVSEVVESFSVKLDSNIDVRVRAHISKSEPIVKQLFGRLETEHEYKLIKSVNELLSKKDQLSLQLSSIYEEYTSNMITLSHSAISTAKDEISKITSKSMEQHKDVAANVLKYKDDLDTFIQLKKKEFDSDIKKSIEKHCKEIIGSVIEQAMLSAAEKIDQLIKDKLENKALKD